MIRLPRVNVANLRDNVFFLFKLRDLEFYTYVSLYVYITELQFF